MARAETRERILRAAVRALAADGYSRTTARSIARMGGFAPGVIYYHFDDLDHLFAATAQFTSGARLERYRAELHGVTSGSELIRRLRALYAEDRAEGHIAAVQELIAAATATPRLATQIRAETTRWQDFAEQVIAGFLGETPFATLIPAQLLARAAVAGYLGMEMLSHLDADRTASEAFFDAATRFAALFDSLYQR